MWLYITAMSQGLGIDDLAEIAQAAVAARIATLLIEADREVVGQALEPRGIDADAGALNLTEQGFERQLEVAIEGAHARGLDALVEEGGHPQRAIGSLGFVGRHLFRGHLVDAAQQPPVLPVAP